MDICDCRVAFATEKCYIINFLTEEMTLFAESTIDKLYLNLFFVSISGIVASCFSPGLVVNPSRLKGLDLLPFVFENTLIRKSLAEGRPSTLSLGMGDERLRSKI